jgi:hypothetical protein
MAEQPTKQQMQKDIEAVRDLFARAHDYIAQASHPGHLGGKVAEVLNFLAFQYNDFKTRAENLGKQIEADAKMLASKVDVEAAKAATDAVLVEKSAATSVLGNDANQATTATSLERASVEPKA